MFVMYGTQVMQLKFYIRDENGHHEFISEEYEYAIGDDYLALRLKACEMVNPQYPRWNREFVSEYGREPYGEDDKEYLDFIAHKHDVVFETINKTQTRFKLCNNPIEGPDIALYDEETGLTLLPVLFKW